MQKMQENQLYVFDPKAMHQIFVKVRFISPNYLLSTPFSTNILGSIHLRRDHDVHWVPGIFTFVNPRTLKFDSQRKQAHVWPWTSCITWWVHFSLESKECQQDFFPRGAASQAKENVEPSVLNYALARDEQVMVIILGSMNWMRP